MTKLRGSTSKWTFEDSDSIGSGGNSMVFKAYRDGEARPYALKCFTDGSVSEKKLVRFRQEIITMQSLKGVAGCSELIDYGIGEEHPFYVMPLYSGGDLHKKFIKYPRVPRDVFGVLNLFIEVVETVSKLHAAPLILAVRDIKPQNILLDSDGHAIVCDFGLALWSETPDEERLTTQKGVGSSGYRPPEWATHYPESQHVQGDIWSLGRTLWAMLAAQVPPSNYESLGTAEWHLKKFLGDARVAGAVQGLINQCTKINPEHRPTAAELLEGAHDVLRYCSSPYRETEASSLDDKLAAIAIQLPGSEIVATAAQLKAELDSKFAEIEDCRSIVLARLREFIPKLSRAIPDQTGRFFCAGRVLYREGFSWKSNAYIQFEPNVALQETGFGHTVQYIFWFGLNSNNEFFWTEVTQLDGHDSELPLINPKSLSTLAAQKCGQIETILANDFLSEIERMLGFRPRIGATSEFINSLNRGSVDFDYSSNDGSFTIGSGNWRFEIRWQKASDECIYLTRPSGDSTGVAIAEAAEKISDIKSVSNLDFTSRVRTVKLHQIAVVRNPFGYYAAVLVRNIWDNSRAKERDRVEFDFVILDDRSQDFSSTESLA